MKVLMIATLSLITAASSFAQINGQGRYGQQQNQQIQIHIDQHLQGQSTVKLKQLIKQQHPGIDVQDLQVKSVKVVAKSKQGNAEVVLISGQSASYPQKIGGTPYNFQSNAAQTFDKIIIQNPARIMAQGKLQLELKGNIKLKKVVVIAKQMQKAQNIVIDTYGQHMQGLNVLKVKQMLKQQNPGLDVQSLTIKKVTLFAKSKQGGAQATLVEGQSASYPQTIPGSPRAFQSVALKTFSQIVLQASGYSAQGKLQVELKGNIKILKMIITVEGLQGGYSSMPTPRVRPRGSRRG